MSLGRVLAYLIHLFAGKAGDPMPYQATPGFNAPDETTWQERYDSVPWVR